MNTDKFAGHTPKPWSLRKDEHGLFMVAWHGMVIAQFIDKSNAELIRSAPELLAENERLRARVADLIGAITSLNHAKHHEVIIGDDVGYYQRKEWVEWILELATDAYLAGSAGL